MSEVISGLTGPQFIAFVSVVGSLAFVTVVSVVGIVVPYLSAARRAESVCQLKRDLVAAGYSAADIERVIKAGTEEPAQRC